jgi:glucose/arabinose dehydrogenase
MRALGWLVLLPGLLSAAPTFTPAFGALRFQQPVALVPDPAGTGAFYVVEQPGRIWHVQAEQRQLFADLSARVRTEGPEEGLLSLAFHPGGPKEERYYCWYSVKGAKPRRNRLVERRVGHDDERILLETEKRWGNHNGGTLLFGSDGFLYLSLGDGGGAGDTDNNAQNLQAFLGKVLRLDIDHQDDGRPYAIPKDNPFAGRKDAYGEIWAYGLRNPWRMAFDSVTGELWAGDVGQSTREEVDVITRGGNYGWNLREGFTRYRLGTLPPGLIDPVLDYGRSEGICVTGGVVGRGQAPAWAQGRYLFADFGSRRLWSLDAKSKAPSSKRLEGKCPEAPSSFGQGTDGSVYVVGYEGGIFRLE